MAGYGTTSHRPSTNSPPQNDDESSKYSLHKNIYTFTFSWPFSLPSTPESGALRIVRNLEKFSLYYTIFVWTVLFITLIPKRKVSIVYLVATTEVAFLYVLLLRALPDSVVLHKIIDKRFVLFLVFVIVAIEMVLTRAGVHLFVTLFATVPIVLLHAVLIRREGLVVNHEEEGEMVRLVHEKLGDVDLNLV